MKNKNKKGFSLIELIIVIAIIGILSGAAYIGIQKVQSRNMNDKVLDDLIAISNAMEQYKRDHFGEFPMPSTGGNMNLNCFYADATYSHDCDASNTAFVQGMIDNNLLSKRYLQEVPTDPRTGSRYVYGVTTDKQYFQVAGNFLESNGNWVAKTVGNLAKGYHLPSVIRSYNGPNFVIENGSNLPYSPDHLAVTGTLHNINILSGGDVIVNAGGVTVIDGLEVTTGDTIETTGAATVDIYFSDGSTTHLAAGSEILVEEAAITQNDADGIITKIKVKLFSGKIWNKVARLASKSEFNIQTTSAIAGVRGTEFGMEIIDEIAGTANVLLTIGEICLGDDSVDIVDCDGGTIVTVGPGEDPVTNDMTGTTTTPSLGLTDLQEQQANTFYLNDNIRPRILSVEAGTVTVANLKDYYGVEHDIQVTTLAAYTDIDSVPAFTLDGLTGHEGDYVMSSINGDNLVFRFEDDEGNVSGFSEPPITIESTTVLTEEEIYGGEVEEEEVEAVSPLDCELQLTYPQGGSAIQPEVLQWYLKPDGCEALMDTYTVTIDSNTFSYIDPVSIALSHNDYSFVLEDNGITDLNYGIHDWSVEAVGIELTETASFDFTSPPVGACVTGSEQTQTCDITDGTSTTTGIGIQTTICPGEEIWPDPLVWGSCIPAVCNPGYKVDGDYCIDCGTLPTSPDGTPAYTVGCDWECTDTGYEMNATEDGCEAIEFCSNNIAEGSEVCDGTDLKGNTCDDITTGLLGTLACDSSCTSFDTTGCGKITVSPDQTYYKADSSIPVDMILTGFDTTKLFVPSTSGFDWSEYTDLTGGIIYPSDAGTYTFYNTSDASITKTITFCDYVGVSGNECWILADESASCTMACEVPALDLICDTDPTWNDDSSCTICKALINNTGASCSPATSDIFAPWTVSTLCRYRGVVDTNCIFSEPGKQRICKCVE